MASLFLRQFPGPSISLNSLPLENVFIAASLHAGHGYSSPFGVPSGPTAFLAPGYPMFIYALTRITGMGMAAVVSMLFLQTLFSLATVAAVMFVARRDFGTRVSNLAGLICACSIPLLLAPIWLWETSLSALILTLFVCIPNRKKWSTSFCALGGAISGLTALVNPALVPSILLICGWHLRQAKANGRTFALAMLLVLSPWILRNYIVLHAIVPVRDSFGFELWMGNHPSDVLADSPKASLAERATFFRLGETQYMRSKEKEAVRYIRAAPGVFVHKSADRLFQYWYGSDGTQFGAFLTLFGFGGLILFRARSERWVLYAIPLILFPFPYYLTHAEERFRYVVDPLLVVLSANCLSWILDRVQRQTLTARKDACKAEVLA